MRSCLAIATLFCLALSSAGAQEKAKPVFQLHVWAGPNAKADPRVVGIQNHHACDSKVAVIKVDRMPALAKKESALAPELVVEFNKSGSILRRWAMPIDLTVAAVAGDRILVALSTAGAKALSISSRGALALTFAPSPLPPVQQTQCPAIKSFGDSDYLRCFEFQDLNSGEVRRIAYQRPCT